MLVRGHQPAGFIVDIDALAPDGIERHRQLHRCFSHFDLGPELLVVRRGPVRRCDKDIGAKLGQVEPAGLARCYVVERRASGHEDGRGVGKRDTLGIWLGRGRCDARVCGALVMPNVDEVHGVAEVGAEKEGELGPHVVAGGSGGKDSDFVGLGFGGDDWLQRDCDGCGGRLEGE